MRIRNIILAICLAVLMPGMAAAKRPQAAPEPGCDILVDKVVYKNTPYAVKVVRVPSYPGAWRNPSRQPTLVQIQQAAPRLIQAWLMYSA